MAELNLNSLFGQDPRLLQQAMDMQMAKASPEERLYMMGAQGGRALGQGLGNLFGVDVQDPMVKKASALRALASEYDTNTPEGLAGFAQAASKIDPRAGMLAAQQAQAMLKTQSEINKNNREKAAADPIQQILRTGKFTPKSVAAYAKSNNIEDLDNIDKADPTTLSETKDGIFLINKNTGYKIARIGDSPERGTVVKPVDVAGIIKEIGTKEDIKSKAEAWKQAGTAYTAQVPMLNKLDEVATVLPKSFTGSFSEPALQFGKALSALGIPVDEKKLVNTEYVNSVSAQVLQTIARSFPGSLAVKEMEQLVKSKFNSKQQLETMTRILRDLRTELQAGALSYEQLSRLPEVERYSKDMNFLTGQNYKKLNRLNALMDKHQSGTISKAEQEEAQKLQQELK